MALPRVQFQNDFGVLRGLMKLLEVVMKWREKCNCMQKGGLTYIPKTGKREQVDEYAIQQHLLQ